MERKAKDSERAAASEKAPAGEKATASRKAKGSEKAGAGGGGKASEKTTVGGGTKAAGKAPAGSSSKAVEKPAAGAGKGKGTEKTTDGEKPAEVISVRGVVAPSEWDMRDEVTAVTIYAQDEAEYLVNARPMVKRLMKLMDEEIEAHGMLGVDEYGNEVFVVADFAPVDVETDEDGADEWDDEEDSLVEDEADLEDDGSGDELDEWSEDAGRRHRPAPGAWKRRPKI